jgi:hypothetical protein
LAAAAMTALLSTFSPASSAFAIDLAPGDVLASGGTQDTPFGLFRIDPTGGMAPPELVLAAGYVAYAFDAEGNFIANAGNTVVAVDLSTGEETPISGGEGAILDSAADLFLGDGVAYGVDDSASIEGVVEVNLDTGAQTIVASKGHLIDPKGGTIGPDGFLYVADPGRFGFFEGKIVKIDPDAYDPNDITGMANQEIIISNRTGPTGLVFEADGNLLVTDSTAIVRFEPPVDVGAQWTQVGFLANFSPQVLGDIELDLDGSAVVAGFDPFSSGNAQVTRVSSDGMEVTTLTDALRAASRVAIVPVPEPRQLVLQLTALGIAIFLTHRRAQEIA